MHPSLLLLTDSRLPAGGHAHSGGTERAIASGAVHDVPSLASFLRGRLHTTGTVSAALSAAACTQAAAEAGAAARAGARAHAAGGAERAPSAPHPWLVLDAEVDARTASPAQRDASRAQGRLLLRVARRVWPHPVLDDLADLTPSPHHPVALGAAAHVAGAGPEEAALAAAYHAITGPATAAVRLLGLDPVAVHALLAGLTPDLTAVAAQACLPTPEGWESLPAYSSPALDLLAEQHAQAEVRLFIS